MLELTSNTQPFHQGSSLSHACPRHYSIYWFWPLPCTWCICCLLSRQSCTAASVLLLASSNRTHQQSLSKKLKRNLKKDWFLSDWANYPRDAVEKKNMLRKVNDKAVKIILMTYLLDSPETSCTLPYRSRNQAHEHPCAGRQEDNTFSPGIQEQPLWSNRCQETYVICRKVRKMG